MRSKSKAKGNRGELSFKVLAEEMGFRVIRGKQKDEQDILIDGFGEIEIKYRQSIPKCLYQWLEEKPTTMALAVKRAGAKERKKWLVVLGAEAFFDLLARATSG